VVEQGNSSIKKPNKYAKPESDASVKQGEIISDLIQIKLSLKSLTSDSKSIEESVHPLAIVVSQDCDLDWDFKARQGKTKEHKLIPNILFCEVTTATNLAAVIMSIDNAQSVKKSQIWSRIPNNKDERYQFLEKIPQDCDLVNEGLEELAIDFKRYFTLPSDEVYKRIEIGQAKRRTCLQSPYLEHFITRFYYFQSRVALPEDHYSE